MCEALRAATANPAEFLKAAGEFGVVAEGKQANLILLEGNPLNDVGSASKQTGVMIKGRWLTQTELRKKLDEIVASYQTNSGS